MSSRFLAWGNLVNVVRQSSYLTMVAMGQMLALLTGGFDLSVGTIIAITSVVGAMAMTALYTAYPDAVVLSIALGMLAGVGAGVAIGILNGVGVALLGVSPFMMTLGMASIGFGIALFLTGGVPVYGMPQEFGKVLGFGQWLGIPRADLRHRRADRLSLCPAELDAHGPLSLCGRRQSEGLGALGHQHPLLPVHGLCALRGDDGHLRHHADGAARHRRGQYRRLHAAGIHRGLRDRRRLVCAAARAGWAMWCWGRSSSA